MKCHRPKKTDLDSVRLPYFASVLILALNLCSPTFLPAQTVTSTEKIAKHSDGTLVEGGYTSDYVSITADGKYVVYQSGARNLVDNDTNGRDDIFLYDIENERTTRINLGPSGVQGNRHSDYPSTNADGSVIAFHSQASNLISSDTNGTGYDVFVWQKETQRVTLVGKSTDGVQGSFSLIPAVSGDGRFVAFQGGTGLVPDDNNGRTDIFVHHIENGTTEIVSIAEDGTLANGDSAWPVLSYDGRYIAFVSSASNLVSGDNNGVRDAFVKDMLTGEVERVSIGTDGSQFVSGDTQLPSISADGCLVAFMSTGTGVIPGDTGGSFDVFVRDRHNQTLTVANVDNDGVRQTWADRASISPNGRFVSFYTSSVLVDDDTNGLPDVYMRDLFNQETKRITLRADGTEGDLGDQTKNWRQALSQDGSRAAYRSGLFNLDAPIQEFANAYAYLTKLSIPEVTGTPIGAGECGCGVSVVDTDGDGTPDCNDECPHDPLKLSPGVCGCGISDTDSDLDGTFDCDDGCRDDPAKDAPGVCGCAVYDSDTDHDGTFDCDDDCPEDAEKTDPLVCGCGVSDTDTDGDGVADCDDECLLDSDKTSAGICGCGVEDSDSDQDGTADCEDQCPADPIKTIEGMCGCGVADTDFDNDGTADCNDECPSDPEKTEAGQCGCGEAEPDPTLGDGTLCIPPNDGTLAICHKGRRNITVAVAALPAHLAHGDLIGTCSELKQEELKQIKEAAAETRSEIADLLQQDGKVDQETEEKLKDVKNTLKESIQTGLLKRRVKQRTKRASSLIDRLIQVATNESPKNSARHNRRMERVQKRLLRALKRMNK